MHLSRGGRCRGTSTEAKGCARSFDFAYVTQAASFTNALALSVTVSRAAPGDRNWNSLGVGFWSWQRGHPRLSDVGVLRWQASLAPIAFMNIA